MAQLTEKKGLYLMIQPLSDKKVPLDSIKAQITAMLPPCPENQAYLLHLCHEKVLPEVQRQRLTALGCLLALLRAHLPTALSSLRLYRDELGRPYARTEAEKTRSFDFNLTHSRFYAGCALLLGEGRVGLDIEEAIPAEKAEKIAARFFSEAELRYLHGLPQTVDPALETAYLWTAKEALAKQDGRGFPLRHDSLAPPSDVWLWRGSIQGSKEAACSPSVLTVCAPADCPFPVLTAASLPVHPKNPNPM